MALLVVVRAPRRWTVTNCLVSTFASPTTTLLLIVREAATHGTGPVAEDRGLFIAANWVQHVLDSVVARHLLDLFREMRPTVLALLKLAQRTVELEELLRPGALVFDLLAQLLGQEVARPLKQEHFHAEHAQRFPYHLVVEFFHLAGSEPTVHSCHIYLSDC